jgi:SOS-response transcriptional repressor LexA
MHQVGLTEPQRDALFFIRSYLGVTGVSPSLDDIRRALGLSSRTQALALVRQLEARGHIRRGKKLSQRSISLCETGYRVMPPADLQLLLEGFAQKRGLPPEQIILDAVQLYLSDSVSMDLRPEAREWR